MRDELMIWIPNRADLVREVPPCGDDRGLPQDLAQEHQSQARDECEACDADSVGTT